MDRSGNGYVIDRDGHLHWGKFGAAGMLIYVFEGEQVRCLLQKRSPHVHSGGTWSIPGGALDRGESPALGALREAFEEMGSVPHLDHVAVITHDFGGWEYHTVIAEAEARFTPEDGQWESESAGWFTFEEMKGLPLHPGFAKSVTSILHTISTARERRPVEPQTPLPADVRPPAAPVPLAQADTLANPLAAWLVTQCGSCLQRLPHLVQ